METSDCTGFTKGLELMKQIVLAELEVDEPFDSDKYKDIARIHYIHRGTPEIKAGRVVKICVNRESRFFALYGLEDDNKGKILLDLQNRRRLGVELRKKYLFTIRTTGPWEKLRWACEGTDPAPRIAAWIAVWSAILGIVGILLGLYPIVKELMDTRPPRTVESEAPATTK
jgi:hypothetical protein